MLRAVLFLVALQLVSACGSDQPSGAGPVVSKSVRLPDIATQSFAGKVGDTDAYVAVTDLDGTVLVYLCDGKPGATPPSCRDGFTGPSWTINSGPSRGMGRP